MVLNVGQLKDSGRVRENQEDDIACIVPEDLKDLRLKGALFVVADGVGGRAAGDVASRMAIDLIPMTYYDDMGTDREESLRKAIQQANADILQERRQSGQGQMATTAVCAVVNNGELTVGHVGDSRAYLWRRGHLQQLTRDHSWVAEQMAQGLLSEQEARDHPNRHVITRALGNQPSVVPDIGRIGHLEAGDRILLCSDGLHEEVDPKRIAQIVQQYPPQQACQALVDQANQVGGNDNIAVVIVEYQELPTDESASLPTKTVSKPLVVPGKTTVVDSHMATLGIRKLSEVEYLVSYHHERNNHKKQARNIFQLPDHREVQVSMISHPDYQIHGDPSVVELSVKLGEVEQLLYLVGFLDMYACERLFQQYRDRFLVIASGHEIRSFDIGTLRFYLHLSDCKFYHDWGKHLRSVTVTIRVQKKERPV